MKSLTDKSQPIQTAHGNRIHGGAFFNAIGVEFDALERHTDIINADVLDAWYPPSPRVVETLQRYLPWLVSTSPPVEGEGLQTVIARTRGVARENVLPGSGSSSLIYMAFQALLKPHMRALILDPTYGEYDYVLTTLIGCSVDRLSLHRTRDYRLDLDALLRKQTNRYDIIILVNPNSPTGQVVSRNEMEYLIQKIPRDTLVWVDETYIDFVGAEQSIETLAASSENVIVNKSMSKVYSLSGMRVGYLVGSRHIIQRLSKLSPPWAVSLLAQVAAVEALKNPSYYVQKFAETRTRRQKLYDGLQAIEGIDPIRGYANYLLFHLQDHLPNAADFVNRCSQQNLYLRDTKAMGETLGERAVRIAVKDEDTNVRMLDIIRGVVHASTGS